MIPLHCLWVKSNNRTRDQFECNVTLGVFLVWFHLFTLFLSWLERVWAGVHLKLDVQVQKGGNILDVDGHVGWGGGSWKLNNFHGRHMCIVPYVPSFLRIWSHKRGQLFVENFILRTVFSHISNLSEAATEDVLQKNVFSYEFYKIFKSTLFKGHLWTTASKLWTDSREMLTLAQRRFWDPVKYLRLSSHRCPIKESVLKNFAQFTEKHLY